MKRSIRFDSIQFDSRDIGKKQRKRKGEVNSAATRVIGIRTDSIVFFGSKCIIGEVDTRLITRVNCIAN